MYTTSIIFFYGAPWQAVPSAPSTQHGQSPAAVVVPSTSTSRDGRAGGEPPGPRRAPMKDGISIRSVLLGVNGTPRQRRVSHHWPSWYRMAFAANAL
jgi:hypothetical protein